MAEGRVLLTFDEAVAMLPEGDTVHTFRQAGGMRLGADWPREDLLAHIAHHGAELAGPIAMRMGHGLLIYDLAGLLFVETRRPAIHP